MIVFNYWIRFNPKVHNFTCKDPCNLLYVYSAYDVKERALIFRHCPSPSNHIYLDMLARKRNLTSVSNAPLVPNLTMPSWEAEDGSRETIGTMLEISRSLGDIRSSSWQYAPNSAKGDRSKIRLRRKSRNCETNSHISLRTQNFA